VLRKALTGVQIMSKQYTREFRTLTLVRTDLIVSSEFGASVTLILKKESN